MPVDEPIPRDGLAALLAERGDDELTRFVDAYYEEVSSSVMEGRLGGDLLGAALSHCDLMAHRDPDVPAVRVYNPTYELDGWQTAHSVAQIVTTDSPFIVDSVTLAVERAGYSIHRIVHPVLTVKREP